MIAKEKKAKEKLFLYWKIQYHTGDCTKKKEISYSFSQNTCTQTNKPVLS